MRFTRNSYSFSLSTISIVQMCLCVSGCVCECASEAVSKVVSGYLLHVNCHHEMAMAVWRNISAHFICSHRYDAVRISGHEFKMLVIATKSKLFNRREMGELEPKMCAIFSLNLFLSFCLLSTSFVVYLLAQINPALIDDSAASKDKRCAYFSFHVIFKQRKKCPFYNLPLMPLLPVSGSFYHHFTTNVTVLLSFSAFSLLQSSFGTHAKSRLWTISRDGKTTCVQILRVALQLLLSSAFSFVPWQSIKNSDCCVLVFCLLYTTSKYTSTLLLLLLKSISFSSWCCHYSSYCSSVFFVSVCSMYAFFIIIIRCYRTFSLAHTHPEKWRDDFSFGLLFFFLFCSSSLFFFSSTVAIVHNWLYFTPYDISRSSVLCIFHVEYWTLNRWKCAESVATCCGNRIEHSVRERAFAQTHVWKFNLHSFRFVDFLTFISICPTMSLSICLLSMPRALKRFRKISIRYAVCWCYKHLRLPISIGSPFLVPAHTPPLLSYSSSASLRSKRRKGTKITKRWIAQSEIYRQTTAEFSSTAVINYCVPICSEAVYRFLSFAIVCCRFAIYSGLFIKMYNDLFGPSHSTA